MKITSVRAGRFAVPLKTPFKTALRTVHAVDSVLVQVRTASGLVGYGEAPSTPAITGEDCESILAAVAGHIGPAVTGADVLRLEDVMARLHASCAGNTSAKAAVDMAVYDLFAQALHQPLWRVLGGARSCLETDITISANAAEEMARDAAAAAAAGYGILKVKVGKGGAADAACIAAVHKAAGPGVRLRIDANQGWTVKEAIDVMARVEAQGIFPQLLEQPVATADIEGMAKVRRAIKTPILADESVFSPADVIRVANAGAADFVNIKLMKAGGIHGALRLCAVAETLNLPCMMGCMLESRLAVSAAAHLAAGRLAITMADLDGPALCREDPFTGGPRFVGEGIFLGEEAGIGIAEVPQVL